VSKKIRISKTRIQLEVGPERIKELETLMSQTGLRTKADLLESALALFEWAIHERSSGNVIASLDEASHEFKQVCVPSIERVAPKK